jgi:DNA-binding transcriptional regulator YiaG
MKQQAPVMPGGAGFLSKSGVARRYSVSTRTVDRWKGNPKLEFPPADLTILNREYRSVSTMEKWERRRAIVSAT